MVTLSEFKNNIKRLLNQYLYTKEETRQNFDNFINTKIGYTNGTFHVNEEVIIPSFTLWQPELNGETGADYAWSYSETNGEAIGKGFILHNGFDNVDKWELTFDFKHDNIRYTGICFIAELGTYNGNGGGSTALTTWEGSWSGGAAYASYTSGTVGYFDVKVTKIDSTHVRLQSETLNRDTTVEVPWLSSATKLSFGARHNSSSSSYGPCRIKNVKVEQI